jgi:formylglycine-generating enzyme required for sulfatase activity
MYAQSNPLVTVQGGTLPKTSGLAGTQVETFEIGKYAVTMDEWQGVRNWAIENGFDMAEGMATDPEDPVTEINWYDCVKWCNAKSEMEGLDPVYGVKGDDGYYCSGEYGHDGSENVVIKPRANGYRLPTEAEWEWAAQGGCNSQGYTYAGSNYLNDVGWYGDNSGGTAHVLGKKAANELGLYDMSGNIWEWCWDLYTDSLSGSERRFRGGCWRDEAKFCAVSVRNYRHSSPCLSRNYTGFRLARSS